MRSALRQTVLVSALAVGVTLAICGPAGAASAAGAAASAPAATAPALGNYRISGDEDAIGCLTAHRCVAVGYGGGKAPGQVVTVVAGKQVRVAVARTASNLVAVSCPNRFGCWAIGPPRTGDGSWVLVKIGPAGTVRGVTSVSVLAGVSLSSISCTSMTSCEVFGTVSYADGNQQWYLASWNGRKLSHRTVSGPLNLDAESPGGISCWQATCVAVGTWWCGGSSGCEGRYAILTTSSGKLETADLLSAAGGFSDVSCVSSSTCYATTSYSMVVTLNDGVMGAAESQPVDNGSTIECAGTTCWTAGLADSYSPAAFVMITDGAPTGTPLTDSALAANYWPSIARRGTGFAAVGEAAVDGGPRVSEVVTN